MRILFAGNPAIAVPVLEELFKLARYSPNFVLAAVLTKPDSPRGRGNVTLPTDVGAAAERLIAGSSGTGGPAPQVLKLAKLDAAARALIASLKPELLVSFAYGRIFGPMFLDLFTAGGINIHPSLLPKFRGPTPIPAAILAREAETGISVQRLALEMDSGDILMQERIALSGRETTASLSEVMAKKAAELLPLVLNGIESGTLRGAPQNHNEASHCSLISKEDGLIDWNKTAEEIDAQIRAYDPWPQSWTMHNDQQLFILKAEAVKTELSQIQNTQSDAPCVPGLVLGIDKKRGILVQTRQGVLAVTELQYSSKKILQWKDFLNGARNFIGSRLKLTEVKKV